MGGVSAGDGVGGNGSLSADGKILVAPMLDENIALPAGWIDESIASVYNYTITEIYRLPKNNTLLAIGVNSDNSEGIVLRSNDNGATWRKYIPLTDNSPLTDPMVTIGFLNSNQGIIGGYNGKIYYTNRGTSWEAFDPHPEGNTDAVKTYWAIDFILRDDNGYADNGVIGLELEDGTGAVWYTTDQANKFSVATGVTGVPTSITNTEGVFFMTTREGRIFKSTDKGATWVEVFDVPGGARLNRIQFSEDNPQNGMAASLNKIFWTNDAGESWTRSALPPPVPGKAFSWYDLCWLDAEAAYVVGELGIYLTKDAGKTWEESHVLSEGKELRAIEKTIHIKGFDTKRVVVAAGDEGQFCKENLDKTMSSYLAGLYDVERETWTPLPTHGYESDILMASPWGISGDGKVALGQAYTYKLLNETSSVHAHATAWIDGEAIDLGSKFADRNRITRAMASSYDGSVIVGFQDIFGPWFGTVWRKDAEGSYKQELFLKDPNRKEEDIDYTLTPEGRTDMMSSLIGGAKAVSYDGKWIAGDGTMDTATPKAWLWSEETGLEDLTAEVASVSGMNNDGTIVVGFNSVTKAPWIWTREKGGTNLETYLEEELGFDLGGRTLRNVYRMSVNGRYLTGYCHENGEIRGYLIDLSGKGDDVSTGLIEQINAAVYPNPVANELHIDVPFDNVKTVFTLYDMQGRVVRTMTTTSVNNVMNVSDIASGLYILNVEADNARRAFKVEIR